MVSMGPLGFRGQTHATLTLTRTSFWDISFPPFIDVLKLTRIRNAARKALFRIGQILILEEIVPIITAQTHRDTRTRTI